MKVSTKVFGEINNQEVHSYTLKNNKGIEVTCLTYGCIISDIRMPDSKGKTESIVLGFDTIKEYQDYSPYFGAVVGRVAGRIKGGSFQLDNQTYDLNKNEGKNHLHGGLDGFDHKLWEATPIEKEDCSGVEFTYLSKDGEEGYPGNLLVKVTYTLNNNDEFTISYEGSTDQKTLVNLTNHTYFNLSGDAKRTVLDHILKLQSSEFLELDNDLLPTGEILNVADTPFDFRKGHNIREGVESDNLQNILVGRGYDHPFLLDHTKEQQISLYDPLSGRRIDIDTDQPAVVVYTGNQLTEDFEIRGSASQKYLGICLETQGLPDSVHHKHFPSCELTPNETYKAVTKYKFSVYNNV
ncbi:aldose epimerase family protein [Priestia megaterium]|jgi:aldose 1-epimerase|uniref:aldose epimerase family protein n=1 Tax=Priestia TaxID=2800373 RepID=UPI0009909DDF|nr:aldose epimerase family protein [Priestia megaterium]MDH6656978.1 aldose 1-epimerase [Bacillus sp. PvP124]RFB34207.1 galactose mutarotase [Bacillus sp. RC]AQU76801.1 galactose mutarotase [Priestia megaterium]PFO12971.1 galactose mutarotase [Priestia megaterium]PFP04284.1 galactose mutarotase [Priestia megaterium]